MSLLLLLKSDVGGQTISPGLISNAPTLFAPTVIPGTVTITPGLISNLITLFAPTITGGAQGGVLAEHTRSFAIRITDDRTFEIDITDDRSF